MLEGEGRLNKEDFYLNDQLTIKSTCLNVSEILRIPFLALLNVPLKNHQAKTDNGQLPETLGQGATKIRN